MSWISKQLLHIPLGLNGFWRNLSQAPSPPSESVDKPNSTTLSNGDWSFLTSRSPEPLGILSRFEDETRGELLNDDELNTVAWVLCWPFLGIGGATEGCWLALLGGGGETVSEVRILNAGRIDGEEEWWIITFRSTNQWLLCRVNHWDLERGIQWS